MTGPNLLDEPETTLPAEPAVDAALAAAATRAELEAVVAAHPDSPAAWAALALDETEDVSPVTAYAYARVGYHRGLDRLRGAGWRGRGPVPWAHEPNRGVLRALYALRAAAERIGETAEVERLTDFLRDADETAIAQIETASAPREPSPPTEAFFIRGRD